MIRRIWKTLLIGASLSLAACGSASKNVKIWYLEPAQGLVRKQENAVLPFPKARGYLCANPADFEAVATCIQAETKIYFLEPKHGLIRKQSGEVRPFELSRGFLCTSPGDFKLLLEDCAAKENHNGKTD